MPEKTFIEKGLAYFKKAPQSRLSKIMPAEKREAFSCLAGFLFFCLFNFFVYSHPQETINASPGNSFITTASKRILQASPSEDEPQLCAKKGGSRKAESSSLCAWEGFIYYEADSWWGDNNFSFASFASPGYQEELVANSAPPSTAKTVNTYGDNKKPSPQQLALLFAKYSHEYAVDKQILERVAWCESSFNPEAVNGPYGGLYQFITSTWISSRQAMGLDINPALRFNPEEAIRTASYKISRDGLGAWPVCSRLKKDGKIRSDGA